MFEHHALRSVGKLAVLLAGVVLGLVAVHAGGFWLALPLVPAIAILCTAIAMLGHEGSHRSFSKSPTWNNAMMYFAFPLFSGLSSLYWREKHDRLHHGHPNVEGMDPDIRPFPFASSRGDHEKCGPGERWFQRNLQRVAFWPMSTLMALGMRRSSLLHLARAKRTRAWHIDAACTLAHYTAWVVIPSIVWGPLIGFAVYSAIWGLVGPCLALIFAPAHMGLPIVREQHHDWLHQVETTRNLELPRVVSYFFIGLDYQVEHHLFPKIPHQNLPTAARITRAWCERNGVRHLSMPYVDALADAAQYMADGWARSAQLPLDVRAASLAMDLAI